MPASFDPVELLSVLRRHGVDFVVVGGVAGALAGSPLVTRDLDIVYDLDERNVERLLAALAEIRARYKDPAGRHIVPDASKLAEFRMSLLATDLGDLDLLHSIASDLAYHDLLPKTLEYDLRGTRIRAIDVETLIEAKVVADRPKDHHALPFLRELARRGSSVAEPDD